MVNMMIKMHFSLPITCPHRTPTQGTSTEDFGQIQPGVHNSSLHKYNLSLEVRHLIQHKINLTNEGQVLSQTTIYLSLEGLGSKPHNHNHLYTQRDFSITTTITSTQERCQQLKEMRFTTLRDLKDHKPNLSHKNQILIDRID